MTFNLFPRQPGSRATRMARRVWKEIGDPDALAFSDKLYVVENVESLQEGFMMGSVPIEGRLPVPVEPGAEVQRVLPVADDLAGAGDRLQSLDLRLKLSDEKLFESLAPSRLGYQRKPDGSWLRPRPAIGVTDIEEVYWKAADLDGQQLVISHLRTSHPSVAQLAFVRLVPLTAEEVEEYRRAGGRPETRILAAEMDGQGPFHRGARTVQDIQENLEPLRGTDVGKLFLGTGGIGAAQTLYPSRVGAMMGAGEEDYPVEAGCGEPPWLSIPRHRSAQGGRGLCPFHGH